MMGSPGYISPEQLQSARDVDVRTDIWALGVTLYHLLSARLPFYRPNAAEMAVRIATEPPDPLEVPPALRAAVFRCLEKSPDRRYADVAALAADLVPFGGPSARAIANVVAQVTRGLVTPPAPVSPVSATAATAASVAVGPALDAPSHRQRPVTAAPPRVTAAPPAVAAAPPPVAAAPSVGASMRIGRPRHRPWWWIVAPIIVLTAAATSAIHWCSGAAPVPSPPVPVVAAAPTTEKLAPEAREPVTVAPIDAGAPETPAWLPQPDASATTPGHRPRGSVPRAAAAPEGVPGAAPPSGSPDATAPRAPPPAAGTQKKGFWRSVGSAVVKTTRTTGCKLGRGATVEVVTCFCGAKDQKRAQAAFANLSGPDREKARVQCASQGIQLR
jgi:serine/threonine-protein kinase